MLQQRLGPMPQRLPVGLPVFAGSLPTAANASAVAAMTQKMPWLVKLERNQLYNRTFIECLGFYLWTISLARSKYEMLENFIDLAGWGLIGVMLPLGLDVVFRQRVGKQLAKTFAHVIPANAKRNILEVPFEFVDAAGVKAIKPHWQTLTKELGFNSVQEALTAIHSAPELVKAIRRTKVFMLFVDLFFMALKGQLSQWGGKWLTAKLSGKQGFSGEFAYATDAYRNKKADEANKSKRKRQIFSLVWGATGAFSLPLAMMALLKHPTSTGWLGKIKTGLGAFNYVDAIFMSKWLILWHNIFNFTAPSILSARDSHELREKISKALSFDFFYFIGDDLMNGLAAKFFSKGHAGKPNPAGQLWEQHKAGPFKWITGRRLSHVYDAVKDPNHWAYKASRNSFVAGLLGTTMGLGIMTTLVNNWYTRKKVLKEQAAMQTSNAVPTELPVTPTVNVNQQALRQDTQALRQDTTVQSIDSWLTALGSNGLPTDLQSVASQPIPRQMVMA
jgi:hypothetical protein